MSEEQNIPEENNEQNESQMPNSKSETENMEVHHHPDLDHKRKNFKEYFLEFLMIFLAVTMGFFAENIRESIKDKRQVNEYVVSMVNDLKSDVALYDSSVKYNLLHCRMIDTIITALTQNKRDNNKLYYRVRQLTMGQVFISLTAKTFEQMKSDGGLRLISKQVIADSMGSYYQWIQRFDFWSDFQKQRLNEVISINDRIFDARVLFSFLKKMENKNTSDIFIPDDNPALITNDPMAFNSVIMRYQYYYGFLKLMNEWAQLASGQATRLITLLKKEYHLE